MAGSKAGAAKARQTMINERFNGSEAAYKEWQRQSGSKGGKKSRGGGFTNNPELARRAGAIGGAKSRRKKVL